MTTRSTSASTVSSRNVSTTDLVVMQICHVITILVAATAAACLALRMYAGTAAAQTDCAWRERMQARDRAANNKQEHIPNLPDALQSWAYEWRDGGRVIYTSSGMVMGRSRANFVHLQDGRTFFQGSILLNKDSVDQQPFGGAGVNLRPLVSVSAHGELAVHDNIYDPSNFNSLQGPNQTHSTLFCCTYMDSSSGPLALMHGSVPTRALCVTSGEENDHSGAVFRNVSLNTHKDDKNMERGSGLGDTMIAYEGYLYYESLWYSMNRRYRRGYAMEEPLIMEIYKLDPTTMALESIANVSTFEDYQGHRIMDDEQSRCYFIFQTVASIMAVLVILPASYAWWTFRAPAAAASPVCLGVLYIVQIINHDVSTTLGICGMLAASIFSCTRPPSWLPRPVLPWVHYSLLAFFTILCLDEDEDIPVVAVGIFCGVVLGDPILEIAGWLVGLGSFVAVSLGADFFVAPIGLIVGVGLVTVGQWLRKYRPFLRYYLRRLLLALDCLGPSHGNRTGNDGITTGLLTSHRN
eukprot:scaffold1695_cov167-Amphora_coffeaeformis.AAC.6